MTRKERSYCNRRLVMREAASGMAAQWMDGRNYRVMDKLTSIADSNGGVALAAMVAVAIHDNGGDWRNFADALTMRAIIEKGFDPDAT